MNHFTSTTIFLTSNLFILSLIHYKNCSITWVPVCFTLHYTPSLPSHYHHSRRQWRLLILGMLVWHFMIYTTFFWDRRRSFLRRGCASPVASLPPNYFDGYPCLVLTFAASVLWASRVFLSSWSGHQDLPNYHFQQIHPFLCRWLPHEAFHSQLLLLMLYCDLYCLHWFVRRCSHNTTQLYPPIFFFYSYESSA